MTENATKHTQSSDHAQAEQPGGSTSTTDHFASAAHETVDRVARNSAEAEREIRARAERLSQKAHEAEEHAAESVDRSIAAMRSYVRDNPVLSAGILFAAGFALSSLLRR